ncbi:MAG: DUF483 domain-containing protein [Candidatus Nezhaarchaeota archaeon]|nr:DUF483 domain-containing protein [Candidatus Nezhaarchaeota archaeon]MCX8141665.1 DUF483 domain-containing protein [Candidatus Nezhaarchaeota archaeon]MDW8049932.1 DUF483 domain-containing protein [Nitrososphaerota archaeon]
MNGVKSFERIVSIVEDIRKLTMELSSQEALSKVRKTYVDFPKVAQVLAEAFLSDRLLGIHERLLLELLLVKKHNPLVRPALDPEFASALRLYSLDDIEVGKFLGYPDCCIESFINECRLFFDGDHLRELKEIRKAGLKVVLTAGFIPCSLYCVEAMKSGLLEHVRDFSQIKILDDELKKRLPHSHSAYQSFYEILY